MLLSEYLNSEGEKRLQGLCEKLTLMANHIEFAIADAVIGLVEHIPDYSRKAISEKAEVDKLHEDVDALAVALISSGHLSARGMRFVSYALKIAMDLEQMEDEVAQISQSALAIDELDHKLRVRHMPQLVAKTQQMVSEGIDSFVHCDPQEAEAVLRTSRELDIMKQDIFRHILQTISGNPDAISGGLHMLLVTRSLRRIGDAAASMARSVRAICKRCPLPQAEAQEPAEEAKERAE